MVSSLNCFFDRLLLCVMTKVVFVLVIVASVSAGIALDRAGWRHRKQLWQLQGGAVGLVAGYLLGRSRLL